MKIGRRVFSMAELKAQEYPTREEIEKIYDEFQEKNIRLEPNRVSKLYESMNRLFEEYENEILLEVFYQGYIAGRQNR